MSRILTQENYSNLTVNWNFEKHYKNISDFNNMQLF